MSDRVGQASPCARTDSADGDGARSPCSVSSKNGSIVGGGGVAAGGRLAPAVECGHGASPPWRSFRLARRALAAARARRAK